MVNKNVILQKAHIQKSYIILTKKAMKNIVSTYYYQKHFYTLSFQLYKYMGK